jgi:lipoprotein signal peptidase
MRKTEVKLFLTISEHTCALGVFRWTSIENSGMKFSIDEFHSAWLAALGR